MMAGRLRHRLQIQAFNSTRNPNTGQANKEWQTVATRFGSVEPMRGEELFQAQQMAPRVTHKITLRGRTEVKASYRIIFDGRALNVSYVTDLQERGIVTVVYAIEAAAA